MHPKCTSIEVFIDRARSIKDQLNLGDRARIHFDEEDEHPHFLEGTLVGIESRFRKKITIFGKVRTFNGSVLSQPTIYIDPEENGFSHIEPIKRAEVTMFPRGFRGRNILPVRKGNKVMVYLCGGKAGVQRFEGNVLTVRENRIVFLEKVRLVESNESSIEQPSTLEIDTMLPHFVHFESLEE